MRGAESVAVDASQHDVLLVGYPVVRLAADGARSPVGDGQRLVGGEQALVGEVSPDPAPHPLDPPGLAAGRDPPVEEARTDPEGETEAEGEEAAHDFARGTRATTSV